MKTGKLIITAFLAILMTGCLFDDWKEDNNDIQIPENGFLLNYAVLNSGIETKSTVKASEQENTINSLFILFFEYNQSGLGKYKGIYEVEISEGEGLVGAQRSIPIVFNSQDHPDLERTESYNLLVCANVEQYLDLDNLTVSEYFAGELDGKTENYAIESSFLTLENMDLPESDLPMSARATKMKDDEIVEVSLSRCVARFDVHNRDDRYELVSVSTWNMYPRTSLWPNNLSDFSAKRYHDGDHSIGFQYATIDTEDPNTTSGGLYAFENYVVSPEQNDILTTCLIIGLKRSGPDPNTNPVSYFRVNINATQLGQHLKRNNMYKTIINRVIGDGETSEEDAFKGGKLLLDVDINDWNVDDNGSIQFDGENILAVPTTKVIFSPAGTTEEGGQRDYSIFTYGSAKLELSKQELPAGITVSLSQSNVLTFVAEASEMDKEGYVELKFGNLRTVISVIQTGKTSEFLELSVDVNGLPPFPHEDTPGNNSSGAIKVTSSGGVTAEIFSSDENAFSFSSSSATAKDATFNDGDTFEIYSHLPRTEPSPRYGFVLVTLNSNPSISRVLILTQNGAGGVSLTPTGTLEFDVFGYSKNNSGVKFMTLTVTASDGDDSIAWEVKPWSGDVDEFTITPDAVGNTINIESRNENYQTSSYSATYRVHIAGTEGIFKEFTVRQDAHTLTVDPPSGFGNIPTAGGATTNVMITTSGIWKAVVTTDEDNKAYFDRTGRPVLISGNTGESFQVRFDELTIPLVEPVATVTVTVLAQDGVTETNVKHSFTIKQNPMSVRKISIQPYGTSYGSIASNGSSSHGTYFRAVFNNNTLIKPDGTLFMLNGYEVLGVNTDPRAKNPDIYQTAYSTVSSREGGYVKEWWNEGKDGHVLFLCQDAGMSNTVARIGLDEFGYAGSSSGSSGGRANRTFQTHDLDRKIIKYLLQDGPFTNGVAIDPSTIAFGGDAANNSISGPAEFVPLILFSSGNVALGIDPSRKLIICGDVDMLGATGTNARDDYNNENNVKFMNNLIAWMTYAAMYGDAFTNQFID